MDMRPLPPSMPDRHWPPSRRWVGRWVGRGASTCARSPLQCPNGIGARCTSPAHSRQSRGTRFNARTASVLVAPNAQPRDRARQRVSMPERHRCSLHRPRRAARRRSGRRFNARTASVLVAPWTDRHARPVCPGFNARTASVLVAPRHRVQAAKDRCVFQCPNGIGARCTPLVSVPFLCPLHAFAGRSPRRAANPPPTSPLPGPRETQTASYALLGQPGRWRTPRLSARARDSPSLGPSAVAFPDSPLPAVLPARHSCSFHRLTSVNAQDWSCTLVSQCQTGIGPRCTVGLVGAPLCGRPALWRPFPGRGRSRNPNP